MWKTHKKWNNNNNNKQTNKPTDSQQQQTNKKKRTCWVVDFAFPTDHKVKLKESETKDKYPNLTRELKKEYGAWWWYQL